MKLNSHRLSVTAGLLLAGMLPLTGCTTALKHAYYELRGAKGDIEFIQVVPTHVVESCGGVRFTPVESTIGPRLCPTELRAAYDRYAKRLESDLRERFTTGGPTLELASEMLYFHGKGLFGEAQLLVRVRFTEGGQHVGDALVVVGSKAFRESGKGALAQTAVETVGKFLTEGEKERAKREEESSRRRAEGDNPKKDD
ncbi:MAG: hypothetical protein PVJ57_15395 [Phycisphaerae bacterium]|jgi:hypothetical protein